MAIAALRESIVAIRDLTVTFRGNDGSVEALQAVNLTVAPGEFVAIVGPSGCGKTTLLRAVGGLQRPTGGEIDITGEGVKGPTKACAWGCQRPTLLEYRTVLENVLLPAEIAGVAHAPEVRARAEDLLRMTGLSAFNRSFPRQLSGGMQQRVALARALVLEPNILLLDEPFSALDALTREQIHLELLAIWQRTGATVILITHDIQEAAFLADRVILMSPRPGRIIAEFPVSLGRPRGLDDRFSPELAVLCQRIRHAMEENAG